MGKKWFTATKDGKSETLLCTPTSAAMVLSSALTARSSTALSYRPIKDKMLNSYIPYWKDSTNKGRALQTNFIAFEMQTIPALGQPDQFDPVFSTVNYTNFFKKIAPDFQLSKSLNNFYSSLEDPKYQSGNPLLAETLVSLLKQGYRLTVSTGYYYSVFEDAESDTLALFRPSGHVRVLKGISYSSSGNIVLSFYNPRIPDRVESFEVKTLSSKNKYVSYHQLVSLSGETKDSDWKSIGSVPMQYIESFIEQATDETGAVKNYTVYEILDTTVGIAVQTSSPSPTPTMHSSAATREDR